MNVRLLRKVTVFIMLLCSSGMMKAESKANRLKDIQKIVNAFPDSALVKLEGITPEALHSRRLKALHALLHSIALDKSGIDIKSDSIISPALKYYRRHGSEDDRLRVYYYTARIHENRQDYETCMTYLTKAEKASEKAHDHYTKGLMYSAKGRVYIQLHDFHKAAKNFESAAWTYLDSGNIDRYLSNTIHQATSCIMEGKHKESEKLMTLIEGNCHQMTTSTLNKYYQTLLSMSLNNNKDCQDILEKYLDIAGDESNIDWKLVARTHLHTNHADKALEALKRHIRFRGPDPGYFFYKALAYERKGEYRKALAAYKEYDRLSGNIGNSIIGQDTGFIEEREQHKDLHAEARHRNRMLLIWIMFSLLALLMSTSIIIAVRKELQLQEMERKSLAMELDMLMLEREELSKAHTDNKEGRKIISERLRIIDSFVISETLNDKLFEDKAEEELRKIIEDRNEFIRETRLIFNQSHPQFINHLQSKGLNEREISDCCLYAIGLNGKMITTFTNHTRHYHIGSDIRRKLGLQEHDTNLCLYIRKLIESLET